MTRLLITGAGGMTGAQLASRALDEGFDCIALDRAALDITDPVRVAESVKRAKPDVVINAAAWTSVDDAENHREEAMRINGAGPGYLADAAAEADACFVHISTDYVFDGRASRPYRPSDPVNPIGAYGETKLAGEEAVNRSGAAHAIVRTSWVYCTRGRNFLTTMMRLAREGRPMRVVRDQRGAPTSAADLSIALLKVAATLHRDRSLTGTYHFSNAGETTWFDFASVIFDECGIDADVTPVTSEEFPTRARRPSYSVLDTSDFQRVFDHAPRPWRTALGETLQNLAR